MRKELTIDELADLAQKFCVDYEKDCRLQAKQFNKDHFKTVVMLGREVQSMSDEKWKECVKKQRGQKTFK